MLGLQSLLDLCVTDPRGAYHGNSLVLLSDDLQTIDDVLEELQFLVDVQGSHHNAVHEVVLGQGLLHLPERRIRDGVDVLHMIYKLGCNHQTFPNRSVELTVLVVLVHQWSGLVGQLVDQHLQLENSALLRAVILVLHLCAQ